MVLRVIVAVLFATLIGEALAQPPEIGIVLLHGKQGSPERVIDALASALRAKGYAVSTPTMPWSRNRIYDATFDDALKEIDREVDLLREKGLKKVLVGGQSLGANVALGYAAARSSIDGIIALAPAHNPESSRFRDLAADDIRRAKEMVAADKLSEKAYFTDMNMGRSFPVKVAPQVYLSWFDPDGPAVMPKSVAAIKQPLPMLFVVGSRDRFAQAKEYVFDRAPAHPKSKYIAVAADHLGVPTASVPEVISWIESLGK